MAVESISAVRLRPSRGLRVLDGRIGGGEIQTGFHGWLMCLMLDMVIESRLLRCFLVCIGNVSDGLLMLIPPPYPSGQKLSTR
jgi:hypothetical protein